MTASTLFVLVALALQVTAQSFTDLVTFGDSYTDVVNIGDGGVPWPVYAVSYANASLHPFAKSGGTCSNNITERPYPSVRESQIPAYLAEIKNGSLSDLNPNETLHSLWIGTNDLGAGALLTGSSAGNLVQATECMVDWVKVLYEEAGARNFLFQNIIPLNLVPMYSPDAYISKFWAHPHNSTEYSVIMNELASAGNALTKLRLENLVPSLPGAHVGLFDSYALFTNMYNNPGDYLNGTAPLNVTGAVNSCVLKDDGTLLYPCTLYNGTDRDSFLWFDELHPSEQADRIVAQEVAAVLKGDGSEYVEWLS